MNALITGMSDLFGRSLGGLVTVRTELDDDLPAVQVDPDQLELAVLNLCINARDAMPEGGAITVATRRLGISGDPEIPDGSYLGVSVTDEGTGIPEEILRRVCEPFFTTKAIGQGTGLGLAMVFGLAQQSKGRLVIDSEVGRGTRVELALPFATEAPQRPPRPPTRPRWQQGAPAFSSSMTIPRCGTSRPRSSRASATAPQKPATARRRSSISSGIPTTSSWPISPCRA